MTSNTLSSLGGTMVAIDLLRPTHFPLLGGTMFYHDKFPVENKAFCVLDEFPVVTQLVVRRQSILPELACKLLIRDPQELLRSLVAKLATSIAKPVLSQSKLLFPHVINMVTAVHTVARAFTALALTTTAPTSSCSSLTKLRYPSTKSIENVSFIASRGALAARKPSLLSGNVFRSFSVRAASTIAVGDKLPQAELSYFDKDGDVQSVKVSELTKGKKVVIFAVPGAFTPTCSSQHLPGFVAKADELRKAGVETLACVSVNDAFVMKAWGESMGVDDKVLMLSDGLGKFTEALGTQVDLSDKPVGLGVRSRRFSMLVEDGRVRLLNLEEGGAFTKSSSEEILKSLQKAAV